MSESHSAPQTRVAPWNNPTFRAIFFQVVVLVAVVLFGLYIFNNTTHNLEQRGIASGFAFLNSTAGFGIITHLIEYSEASTYGRAFLVGLLNTLFLSFLGIIAATILGLIIGVARLSNNWLISKLAEVYIEIFRNIPLLLQIFFWYFAVLRALPGPRQSATMFDRFFFNNRGLYSPTPVFGEGGSLIGWAIVIAIAAVVLIARWARKRQERTGQPFHTVYVSAAILIGLPLLAAALMGFPISWDIPELKGFNFQGGMVIIPEFIAMWFALSIYTASFIAEIVRAGIQSVSWGQTEAAYSLGLKSSYTMRLVILPQALRVIIPPLTSQYLNLMKNSSLAAAIAYPELVSVFTGTVLNQTGQAVEVIAITMAVYLAISLSISLFMNWYNARMQLVER
ncbi:MAG: amino acid ABC transporter permease [Pseudomonadota bacterium]|nr:amino acid ABC transporter permease [Pseudomonadota bacterium]